MMKNSRRRPTRSNNGLLMAKSLCEMSDMPSVITTSSDNMSDSEIVALNVGGVFYTTTRSTLTKYPDSMLGAMFNGSMKPSILDKDGRVFIDRDGQMFGHILEFLRSGKQAVPKDFGVKTRLYFEAQFYQIEPLIAELNHMYDVNDYIHVSRVDNNITGSRTYFIRGTTNAILKVPPEYIDLNTAIKLQTSPEEMRVHTIILKICDSYYNSKEIYSKFVQALTNFGWNHSKYLPLPYFVEDHLEGLLNAKRLSDIADMPSAITTSSDNMSDSEIIALNVGGVVYTTTRSTLTKYPDSMLGAMFNGSMNPSILDKDGRFFIDRDGQMFKFVLEFLRSGKLSLADDSTEKEGLLAEAEYYQLMPLIAKLHDDKGHILDVYKWPTVSECHVIIHGTTTALSKVPPVYIDMQNRLKLQNYLKETEEGEDKSEMITLKFPCSFPDLEKDKMYINFERALKDYGWIKSEYNPLPYFTHDDMYKRNQAGIRGRTAWYHV